MTDRVKQIEDEIVTIMVNMVVREASESLDDTVETLLTNRITELVVERMVLLARH